MAVPSPGRADVVALRRSDRSKPLLLGFLCLAALGAATVSWAEQKGTGAPEDPSRVLVVAAPDSEIDHIAVLERAGFPYATEATLEQLQARAAELDMDETGIDAVLALADEQGYGFVAFENPHGHDFGSLELQDDAPAIEEHARYAVLSVGDLAFPHQLSQNPAPSEVVRMPGIELLQALYAQPRLHPERELLSHHPTVEELHLQAQIDPGLFIVRRIETLESTASNLAVDIENLINSGAARPLGVPLESGGPVPLPDGGVLSVMQGVEIVSGDAFTLDYELAPQLRLAYTPPAALLSGPDHRRPCTALAGGSLLVEEFPELVAGADGRTLLIHTASRGLEVWTWLEGEGCRFERRGRLPSPAEGERGLGVASSEGVVARVGEHREGGARVRLYEAHPQRDQGSRTELRRLPDTALGKPVWLTLRHLVAGGRVQAANDAGEEAVAEAAFVFDAQQPDRVLRIDDDLFGPDVRLRHMAAIPGEQPAFLVTSRRLPHQLYRVSFALPIEQLLARASAPAGDATPGEPEGGVDPPAWVVALTAEDLRIELIHEGGRISHPAVSADGRWATFSYADEDAVVREDDVALLRLDPPATELVMLSEGPVQDQKPRFSADGRHVVFETRVHVSFSGHELVAPRVAAVPQ